MTALDSFESLFLVSESAATYLQSHPDISAQTPSWATSTSVELDSECSYDAHLCFEHRYDDGAEIYIGAYYSAGEPLKFSDQVCIVLPDDAAPMDDAIATMRDMRERLEGVTNVDVGAGIYAAEFMKLCDKITELIEAEGFTGVDRYAHHEVGMKAESIRRQALIAELRS